MSEKEKRNRKATREPVGRKKHSKLRPIAISYMWRTILTILLAPFLIARYILLAREEDRELEKKFGEDFRRSQERVPPFIPSMWGQTFSS